MRTRILLGSAMIAAIALLVILDQVLGGRWVVSALICFLGLAGWCELAVLGGIASRSRGGGLWLFSTGLLGTAYFLGAGWWLAAHEGVVAPRLLPAGMGLLMVAAFLGVILRSDFRPGFQAALLTIVGPLLLGLLPSALIAVYHQAHGALRLAILVLGIKGNDIAAYFVGSAVGRVRFLKVSPKKTLEGCVAAVLFSALWFTLVAALWPQAFFPWPHSMFLGIILSIASQVGDLCESLIKRMYQVKDSSSVIPEFGGVLDLMDSVLFSGFFFWVLCDSI